MAILLVFGSVDGLEAAVSEEDEEEDDEVAEAGDQHEEGGEEVEAGLVQESIGGRHPCTRNKVGIMSGECPMSID